MPKIIAIIIIMLLCLSRTISYAIYTFRQKNITGGIGALVLSLAAAACSVALLM